jgi:hypothetical protein
VELEHGTVACLVIPREHLVLWNVGELLTDFLAPRSVTSWCVCSICSITLASVCDCGRMDL